MIILFCGQFVLWLVFCVFLCFLVFVSSLVVIVKTHLQSDSLCVVECDVKLISLTHSLCCQGDGSYRFGS